MSGAQKMDSRYIQLRCTLSASSRVSEKRLSDFSVDSTFSRMPPTKRLAVMVPMVTMESSSSVMISSMPCMMYTPGCSLYTSIWNSVDAHMLITFWSMSSSRPSSAEVPSHNKLSTLESLTFGERRSKKLVQFVINR